MQSSEPLSRPAAPPPRLRAVEWLDVRLCRRSPMAIAGIIAVLWIAVVAADLATGPQLALSLFYLAPIGIAAWYLGWHAGLVMCAIGTLAWFAADLLTGAELTTPAIRNWNTAVRGSIFLIFTHALAMLRYKIGEERELARTDALTGLSNWRHFTELAERELSRARRYKHPITVAYLDLDNFKQVNDTVGHDGGDRVLREIADVLRTSLRLTDVIARVGGDEFVILLPDQDRNGAEHAIHKVEKDLQAVCERSPGLGFSFGVITALEAPREVEPLVQAGDALMYGVKANGKGACRFAYFAPPEEPIREVRFGSA